MLVTEKHVTGGRLDVEGLRAGYGGVDALRGVDLALEPGRVTAVIGPNGAGKSTLLRCLTGLMRPRAGTVALNGERIDRLSSGKIASLGICQVPEGRRLFGSQTIADNLMVAGWVQRRNRKTLAGDCERIYQRFPILARLRARGGEHLSGGEAQLVAIARALLMHPRLVLLDEPSQGLAPRIVEDIMAVIEEMRAERIAILLVEQNSTMALSLADRAYVIDDGRIVHAGSAGALAADTALTHRLLAV